MSTADDQAVLRALREKMAPVRNVEVALHHYRQMLEIDDKNAYLYNNFGLIYHTSVNNIAKADYAYRKALEVDPNFASAHCNYGVLLGTTMNEPNLAHHHFDRALELQPDDPYIHACRAAVYLHNNDLTSAFHHIEQALALDATDTQALMVMADYQVRQSNNQAAIKYLRKATEGTNESSAVHSYLATLLETVDVDDAIKHHEIAITLDPYAVEPHRRLAVLFEQKALAPLPAVAATSTVETSVPPENDNAHRCAVPLSSEGIEIEHDLLVQPTEEQVFVHAEPLTSPSDTFRESNESGLAASPDASHIISVSSPIRAVVAEDLSVSQVTIDQNTTSRNTEESLNERRHQLLMQARKHFAAAKDLKPNSFEDRIAFANFLIRHSDNYSYTAKQYTKALDLNSESALAHNNLALLQHMYLELDELARDHYTEAIRIDPSYATAHYNLAILLERMREYREAKRHYDIAGLLVPSDVRPLFNAANLLREHLNLPKEAEAMYLRALNVDRNHVMARVNLATLYVSRRRHDLARELLQQAVVIDPESTVALANLAILNEIHYEQLDLARQGYIKALEIDPSDVSLRIRLARLLKGEACVQQLQTCLENPDLTKVNCIEISTIALHNQGDINSIRQVMKSCCERFPLEEKLQSLMKRLCDHPLESSVVTTALPTCAVNDGEVQVKPSSPRKLGDQARSSSSPNL